MAHLLAEFSPANERVDVAAQVPKLLRFARSLGLHGTVDLVGVDRTDVMRRIELEQRPEPKAEIAR
jgi:hypothetical protein